MNSDNSANAEATIIDQGFNSYSTLLWNIEGFKRNVHNLKHYVSLKCPDFIFITEPQLFGCDSDQVMKYFHGEYCYKLTSADSFDPDLPLLTSKAHGGTLIMWKSAFDSYVDVYPTSSSAFTIIIFCPPGLQTSIHICVYLPTAGLNTQFIQELASLSSLLEELRHRFPESPFFLRGDFNVSDKNISRRRLLDSFLNRESLVELRIDHLTYHHFMGNGQSDSSLDKLIHSDSLLNPESLLSILCKHDEPFIDSNHDILISEWKIGTIESNKTKDSLHVPLLNNTRHKILWSQEGIHNYQNRVVPHLQRLQSTWFQTTSRSCIAQVLSTTNDVLTSCAKITNNCISLTSRSSRKSSPIPRPLRLLHRRVLRKWQSVRSLMKLHGPNSSKVQKELENYHHMKSKYRNINLLIVERLRKR